MKKLLSVLLTLAALSAALCVSAAAAKIDQISPTRVWGKVSPWDGTGIFLKNGNLNDHLNEVVIHAGEAPVVDAATGLPLDLESVKEGDTLYAWIGPALTMSLPPQGSAKVIVGNVPADAKAPEYYELAGGGWKDPAGSSEIVFSYWDEEGESQDLPVPLADPADHPAGRHPARLPDSGLAGREGRGDQGPGLPLCLPGLRRLEHHRYRRGERRGDFRSRQGSSRRG